MKTYVDILFKFPICKVEIMLKIFEKRWFILAVIPLITLLVSPYVWSSFLRQTSLLVMALIISLSILFNNRSHWLAYQQAEYTREKMIRNLILDLLGLFLTMGAAMYAGGVAGRYLGLHTGYWIGLLSGFVVGFVAAWAVRSAWGKLVSTKV